MSSSKKKCSGRIGVLAILVLFSVAMANQKVLSSPLDQVPLLSKERNARLEKIRAGIAPTVDALEKRLTQPKAVISIRDLPNAALFCLVTGQDPKRAEKFLRRAFAEQDMDPQSPRYGSLPWAIGNPDVKDENAIQFAMQPLGPILLGYGERLSPAFKNELKKHLEAGIAALLRRQFRQPSYTNIFLMKSVNLILLGEALGDKKAADEGYRELDRWLKYTGEAGIHEFDSSTYYAVDLNSLGLGYRYARREGAKAKFKEILDYFWRDIAANCFQGHLAGPQSRTYDFLRNTGGVDFNLYVEGVRDSLNIGKLDLEKVYVLETLTEQGYHPDPKILQLAFLPERVVQQRWDVKGDADRYHYLTPDFSIGSTSGNYGPQDRLLSIELASPNDLPVISVVPDLFNEPYGKRRKKDRTGHFKPTHLPLNLLSVQFRGVLLALLDLEPAKAEETESLVTNILLPAQADGLMLNGEMVATQQSFTRQASQDSVVGVRAGKGGVALRVFQVEGCGGQAANFALKADDVGLKNGALRFAVTHYQGPERKLTESHVKVGLLFLAEPCADDMQLKALLQKVQKARIENRVNKDSWQVKVTLAETTLEAGRDLLKQRALFRRINGQELISHLLNLNGKDLAIVGK